MKRTIVFTGGGTAGHVTVNMALIPFFLKKGWQVHYIGSWHGIERELISTFTDVTYHGIATGKLRRYMDWNNVKDPFRVMVGLWQAYNILGRIQPHIVFSKGGFVSVPVIAAAWFRRVPSIIHESDLTPGLANRLSIPLATKLCTTFPETGARVKTDKVVHIGAVVREDLFQGNSVRGLMICDFVSSKPIVMVMGGSLGSQRINHIIRHQLQHLTKEFQIIHICGKGNMDPRLESRSYKQFEFVKEQLPHLLAATDVVVSRAGSNSIYEFLALRKPMLLIPLSRAASRGDQIDNAQSFHKRGFADVLMEDELTNDSLVTAIHSLYKRRMSIVQTMESEPQREPLQMLQALIDQTVLDRK
jgi:UDP-N-acetylglucosamine--N-acetylmuramyl-(pentapeptide) pyrophosphoryl-undecaprenol N-acetylglucosamine transferase